MGGLTMEEVKALLRQVIKNQNEFAGLRDVELANKWNNGTIVLKPGSPDLKPMEVSLELFFKKVISVREKLRVLEQKINNHPKLDDVDKVELQQYVTRCYGSLTTFNILFRKEEDKFHGQS
jgi:hypothetical protein